MPRSKYCWDSGLFITILTGEQRAPDEIAGLMEVADAADRGDAIIITSSIVLAEVIGDRGNAAVQNALLNLFKRPSFVMYDPNATLQQKVGDLRRAARDDGRSLKTPDATMIATALAYRADALHTFDDKLLRMNGLICVDRLSIRKPAAEQTILNL